MKRSVPVPVQPPPAEPPTVGVRWLLTALAVTMVLAAVCAYGALCLLFYQGQWQMLFHPSRTIAATPASQALPFEEIRFDVTDTGRPLLVGWWIPAPTNGRYAADTILYLHDGRGDLSDTLPALTALRNLGVNVFAFDYRGFGQSTGAHPTERLATEDAEAAFTWLTDTRQIAPGSIVVYGDGTGATFAAGLAAKFAPAGVVLQDPNPTARQIFASDARAQILPLWLLQNEKLDPAADLAAAHVPRLFIERAGDNARTRQLFRSSSWPKQYADLRKAPEPTVTETLRRFLDEVFRQKP